MLIAIVVAMGAATESQAQMFFQTQWISLSRNHDSDMSYITGPESLSGGAADYDFSPGVRFTIGGDVFGYQVDASFTQIDSWTGHSSGTFMNPIAFDDEANNANVFAAPPVNTFGYTNPLYQAATYMGGGVDETLESEFLTAGATYETWARSDLREFEINFGTSPYTSLWRFSGGFRHIKLSERNRMLIGGTFDALDVDDGAAPGDAGNDPNDALSHLALIESGMVHFSGGADGYNSILAGVGPDMLFYETAGRTENELNGAQFTLTGTVIDGSWITIEAFGKAGIYRNNIGAAVRETLIGSGDDDSIYRRELTDTRLRASFAGNLGFNAIISVTDYINLVGGYEVLFINGVALGSDQADGLEVSLVGDPTFRAQTKGSLIAHGGRLGLELVW